MTGFGRSNLEIDGRNYIIDIKTVNNRYSDISVRLPRTMNFAEELVRKEISNSITRGKVDISINFYDYSNKTKKVILNRQLANDYINQLKEIARENDLSEDINIVDIAKLPEILNSVDSDDMEIVKQEILKCLKNAINNLLEMREKEGEIIKQDLNIRIIKVEQIIEKISLEMTGLIEEYVERLKNRVKELLNLDYVDENRIAQEAVIYADKMSIEEELTRLRSHIVQFKDLINNSQEPIGKKLDFIIQEMNRETNTIGSKSGNNNITNLVINLKVELEDIREQIQNIE